MNSRIADRFKCKENNYGKLPIVLIQNICTAAAYYLFIYCAQAKGQGKRIQYESRVHL